MLEAAASTFVCLLFSARVETSPPRKVDGRGGTRILFRFRYIFTLILVEPLMGLTCRYVCGRFVTPRDGCAPSTDNKSFLT